VDAFLTAMAAGDSQALIALTDPVVDARSDVAALMWNGVGGSQNDVSATSTYLGQQQITVPGIEQIAHFLDDILGVPPG